MTHAALAIVAALVWRLHRRQDAAEALDTIRTAAVIDALRGLSKPLSDDFQYTIGTPREAPARRTLTTINDAVEIIENTQP